MKYKYITGKMAEEAASKGWEAAIKCSALKWWYFGTCTADEMDNATCVGANCALCKMEECTACPLRKHQGNRRCVAYYTLYFQADTLYWIWKRDRNKTNFRKFQAKARRLARVIEKLKPQKDLS